MKHNALLRILILSLFLGNFIAAEQEAPAEKISVSILLKGLIEAPASIARVPEFAIHFAGKQEFNNEDGFFTFTLDEIADFSLLITESFSPNFEQNTEQHAKRHHGTIAQFMIDKETPHRYFERAEVGEDILWQERPLATPQLSIPDKTIIIIMDPSIVERVESWHLESSKNCLQGPKIVLKNTAIKEIGMASLKSLAHAPEVGRYFEMNTIRHKWEEKSGTKISINC